MSYRFTDGQKLNSDEIESVFCNLTSKVTAENYSTMVSQGLYLETSIPIANTTEMIKFRYYNPSHVLIEQENVPIVLDGNGVKTHTVYTALSTTANKPDAASFSTTVKNVSSVNKYLWQYEVTEYTNGTIEGSYADAKIIGVYGDKGETGSRGGIYLGCFATNAQDDSPDMSSSVVFVENDYYLSSSDGYIYLYTNSAWNAITNYTDSRYFEAVNDALGNGLVSDTTQNIVKAVNAWTQNLVAGTALINKLFAKEMTMENGGVFKSQNYDGTITTITDSEGNITDRVLTKNGTTGFAIDSHGNLDLIGIKATNASIRNSSLGAGSIWETDINYGSIKLADISTLRHTSRLSNTSGKTLRAFNEALNVLPTTHTNTSGFDYNNISFLINGYFMIVINNIKYQIHLDTLSKIQYSGDLKYSIRGRLSVNNTDYREGVIIVDYLSGIYEARDSIRIRINGYNWLDSNVTSILDIEGSDDSESAYYSADIANALVYYVFRY